METINNAGIGELKTFHEVTKDNVATEIVIPKFQRDYAQGRPSKKELRGNFLKDLYKVIENTNPDAPKRIYDFIYGQQEGPNSKHKDTNRFLPVDGQQRLTTIFLLHIYLGKRAEKDISFLRKFSYETRDSSLQFCQWLCEIEPRYYCDIIGYIDNHPRMTGAWLNDPTISGMKQTLSDIHKHFSEIANPDYELYWSNVTEKIAFLRLYIKDLDATDDLYIKMNSRGKHLTDFENFKAEVDQLAQNSGKINGEFQKEMDTTWTNLFWGYRDDTNDDIIPDYENPDQCDFTDNGLDDKMLTFFRNYLTIAGVKNGTLSKSADSAKESSIALVKRVLAQSPSLFDDIETILKFLDSKKNDKGKLTDFFNRYLTDEQEEERYNKNPNDATVKVNLLFKSDTDLFMEMMASPLTVNQKLIIEAFFKFILTNSANNEAISDNDFKDRLRILRNLIANSELHDDDKDHAGKMKLNLESVDMLIEKGLDAIMARSDEYSGVHKNHEEDKLKWMQTAPAQDIITLKQIENYEVIRGNLSQLKGTSDFTSLKFKNFREIFHYKADYDFIEKVMIAYGDYYFKYANSDGTVYNYAGASLTKFRDTIFVSSNDTSTKTFETLLNESSVSKADLQAHCDQILVNAARKRAFDWKYYIIKYKSIRWAPSGRYLCPTGMKTLFYMFNASTCYHSDSYLHWNVYNDAVRNELNIKDFSSEFKYGGPLTIPDTGTTIDILENIIIIHLCDGADYYIEIPQSDGIDRVDRVEFAVNIAEKIMNLSTIISKDDDGNEIITRKALTSSDFEGYPCKRLKRTPADTEGHIEENDNQVEIF